MLNYLVRRVLLMIPTLVGITFIVFMIVALSPGGIGAGLLVQAGGALGDNQNAALQQAYIEDRYGLDDPPFVQYARWLSRVSPIKFGRRNLVRGDELVYPPKEIAAPTGWHWYADELPDAERRADDVDAIELAGRLDVPLSEAGRSGELSSGDREAIYRAAKAAFDKARARYITVNTRIEQAFVEASTSLRTGRIDIRRQLLELELAEQEGTAPPDAGATRERLLSDLDDLRALEARFGTLANYKKEVDRDVVDAMEPTDDLPTIDKVRELSVDAVERYQTVIDAREDLLAAYELEPYPFDGFAIPGLDFISLGRPDFGRSFIDNRPVFTVISERLPTTLLLNIVAIPVIYLIAVPSGMLAAARRGSLFDVVSGGMFVALWSIPVVWAGVLGVGFLANREYLHLFPVTGISSSGSEAFTMLPHADADGIWHRGYLLDVLWHLVLPVACLVYGGFAVLSKQTRAAMLDNFNADYVRTARAKGVSAFGVVVRHVFRNSLLPLITMFVGIFPVMLSGSLIVEIVFTIDGMGRLAFDAIQQRDRELLLANTLMIGVVNLIGLLIADVLYALADPRISYK